MSSPPFNDDDEERITLSEEEALLVEERDDNTNGAPTFEPFEPGNIWTQKPPTQFQRKQWRKRVYMEDASEGDGFEIVTSTIQTQRPGINRLLDRVDGESRTSRVNGEDSGDENQPWWSEGKTAPLLNDFDSDRRSFYLSQAGIASSNNINALEEDRYKHSHLGRAAAAAAGISIEMPADRRTEGPTSLTIERPTLGLRNLQQQMSPSTIVTPGKKTWNAVWGQNGARSITSSDKKRKTTSPAAAKTPSRSTPTSRGGKNRRGGRKTT